MEKLDHIELGCFFNMVVPFLAFEHTLDDMISAR